MTAEPHLVDLARNATAPSEAALRFLQLSARLLLEYNVRSKSLERRIDRIAQHLGVNVQTVVGYREVTLALADGRGLHARAPELRINVAVSAGALQVIDELCLGRIGLDEATARLETLERLAPRHGRWVVVVLFGLAASAIAWLLRADCGRDRRERRLFRLGLDRAAGTREAACRPLRAPVRGGADRRGDRRAGDPSGLDRDAGLLPDRAGADARAGPASHQQRVRHAGEPRADGRCRLVLATGILIATALGVVLGGWLTLGPATLSTSPSEAMQLTLALDMALAGVAACGFGAFYNAPWRVLWVSILCGMVGHGLRYVCLDHMSVEISTLFACLAIGLIANAAANRLRLPFSALAFAGAVPMMPGVFIYQSIAGAMRLSAAGTAADPALAAATLALSFKSVFVVGAMALGLLVGARLANLAIGE